MEHYYEHGEECPNCTSGILTTTLAGGCTCFINPPCTYCMEKNNYLLCNKCYIDPYDMPILKTFSEWLTCSQKYLVQE